MKQSKYNITIEKRALEVAQKFVLCKDATVRSIAKDFSISKSTAHKDLTERIESNPILYNEVRKKLDINKEERHIRGGESTKRKYMSLKQSRL